MLSFLVELDHTGRRRYYAENAGYRAARQRAQQSVAYRQSGVSCRVRTQMDAADETEIPAPASGRPWSPEDDALVSQRGLPLAEMARQLGRSYAAVRARRVKLGVAVRGGSLP